MGAILTLFFIECGTRKPTRIKKRVLCCYPVGVRYPVRSLWASPLDRLGFHVVCCRCIPLRVASVLICFTTLIWSAFELYMAEKFLGKVLEDKNILYYSKMVFYGVTIGLMVAAGIMLLGVLLQKYLFVNIYVWYTLVYGFLNIILYTGVVVTIIAKTSKVTMRLAVKIAVTVVWYCLAFYFLLIVNSYKSNLW